MPERSPRMGNIPEPDFGWWFTGLVDGEGCFFSGPNGCSFIINLRADDAPILEAIRDHLGSIGNITFQTYPNETGGRNPLARYAIDKKADCAWLTALFDEYPLRTKKAKDYSVWRDCAIAHAAGLIGPGDMKPYRDDLAAAREYRLSLDVLPAKRPAPAQSLLQIEDGYEL